MSNHSVGVAPEADLWQPLPGPGERWHPQTINTIYFGLNVPSANLGGYLYIRTQPAFPLAQGGVFFFKGMNNHQILDMEFHDYEMTMPFPEVSGNSFTSANGLRIDFVEPGRQARLTYRSYDGETHFDLLATAVGPLIGRTWGLPDEVRTGDLRPPVKPPCGGLEQFMHMTGSLVLNGREHQVDCVSPRDRSLSQVRVERQGAMDGPPHAWTPMYFGPDLCLIQGGRESLDTDPDWKGLFEVDDDAHAHRAGWIMKDNEFRPLVRVRRNVLQRHPALQAAIRQEVEVEDEDGRTYRFKGEAIAMAPAPGWYNMFAVDSVYRWEDEQGRVSHCSYMEMWWHTYQRFAKERRES